MNQRARFANVYDIGDAAIELHTCSIIPIMAARETAMLLLISSILLIANRDTPGQSEQAMPSDGQHPSSRASSNGPTAPSDAH